MILFTNVLKWSTYCIQYIMLNEITHYKTELVGYQFVIQKVTF